VFTSVFEEIPVEDYEYVYEVLNMHGTLIHSCILFSAGTYMWAGE
jgi:hypothetical protein